VHIGANVENPHPIPVMAFETRVRYPHGFSTVLLDILSRTPPAQQNYASPIAPIGTS
jgi:hypothetical protein